MVVKYCGITKEEEIQHLQQLPIDYVGFVFYKKSKRYVDKEQARRLREKLNPSIPAVGVFVEEEIPKILELLQEGIIQGVQLHGEEEEAYVLKLKQEMAKLGIKPFLWQAFILKEEKYIERANTSPADLILQRGGGRTFTKDSAPLYSGRGTFSGKCSRENQSIFPLRLGCQLRNRGAGRRGHPEKPGEDAEIYSLGKRKE